MKKLFLITSLRSVVIIGQLIFIKLYTNILSLDEIGYFYFFTTISYFLNALIFIPYDFFQQAEVFKLKEDGFNLKHLFKLNLKLIKLILSLTIFFVIVSLILKISYTYIILLLFFIALTLYLSTAIKIFLNNHNEQLIVVATMILELLVKISVFYVAIIDDGLGLSGLQAILLAILTAQIASILLLSLKLLKHVNFYKGEDKKIEITKVVTFCYPFSISTVISWLLLQGYRIVLVPLGYVESVGIFALISGIGATGFNSVSTVYSQLFQPEIYKSKGKYIKKYLKWGVLLILSIFTIALLFKNYIVIVITNDELLEYAYLIGFGVLIESGSFFNGALIVFLSIHNDSKALIKVYFVALIVLIMIFLALWVMSVIDVYTIGIPLLISQCVVFIMLYNKSRKYF